MKTRILAFVISLLSASVFAGGKGGTEIALASYNGLGVTVARGIPLNIEFLRANGIYTYGEVELGVGFDDDVAFGADVSGGLLIGLAPGLSLYGSIGPAIGVSNDASFGLGAEVGVNVDVNDSAVIIEAGSHPGNSYVSVGLKF